MRRILDQFTLTIVLAIGLVAQPADAQQGSMNQVDWWGSGGMNRDHMRSGDMMHENWSWGTMGPEQRLRMQRHWTYMNEGVPADYRGAQSSLKSSSEAISGGARLYSENCAACHGARGFGDGEAGRGLVPSPALLNQLLRMPMAGDEYLLWAISEGGERFSTDMPAFKDVLQEDEIWHIIAYMRSGFPSVDSEQ